jgi:LacI family gluconate utilization system Gnt-I transcriptional repressor
VASIFWQRCQLLLLRGGRWHIEQVMKITVADVATAAGVGESTVSRVIRNDGSFSAKTRDRVLSAAQSLGYVPNRLAGSLAGARSKLVAVIVPSLTNIVFADVLRGVSAFLEGAGYQGVFGVTDYDPEKERRLVESFLQYRPSAILLSGVEHGRETIEMLRRSDCKVVEMLDTEGAVFPNAVGFSNAAAGAAAARFMLSRGHRRIGYVGHDLDKDLRAAKRLRGFQQELALGGLELASITTAKAASSVTLGSQLTQQCVKADDVEAIYFANDDLAIGGYLWALAAGIDVPGDLGLMGHNGLEMGAVLPRPLSTIRTDRVEIGRMAAEMAIRPDAGGIRDISFDLVEGQTIGRIG